MLGLLGMKILIVDDHALIRDAMQGVLKKLQRGVVVLEAADSQQAFAIIAGNPDIDLILLDLTLPDREGLSVLTELRERYPAISVVVVSALQDRANVQKVLDLGAAGFIPKSARREVMLSALQLVFAGSVYIPPEILAPEGVADLRVGAGHGQGPAIRALSGNPNYAGLEPGWNNPRGQHPNRDDTCLG